MTGKTPYPITTLYAWIVDDPSGKNGIIGFRMGMNDVQCASSKRHVMDKMRPEVERAARLLGLPVRLQRFDIGITIDVVKP